jgi:hypothetical protein
MNGPTRTVSITGNDTVVLGGRVFNDFADGDNSELAFPNELMAVKTGKNGNSIYAFNASGKQSDVKLRLIRGSDDDKFLNAVLQEMLADPAGFVLLQGQITKRTGDGRGNITYDTYMMSGGVPTRNVSAKSNVEGDTEQACVVYEFKFTNNNRGIL